MEDISYLDFLYQLLDNKEIKREFHSNFKLNLYLTLMFLNNNTYHDIMPKEEINIIENYLRKVNNLKVKIQLKRKETEINILFDEIKEIYDNNHELISKYNKDNLDIINILNSKDPKEITVLIDKLTKIKINKIDKLDYYNHLRKEIISNILTSNYYLENNDLHINQDIISLDEFYDIFDYLLDINNYKDIYHNKEEESHKNIIINIINIIKGEYVINDSKYLIPVILTNLINNDIPNYEEVDTSKFNIDNIKISDLYSLANKSNNLTNEKVAKWRKVLIPSNYLYEKIREMVKRGMYYFKDDYFILENIDNAISDFKVSINKNDMIIFIKENIDLLTKNRTTIKHI